MIENKKKQLLSLFGDEYICTPMLLNANPTRGIQFVLYNRIEIMLCNEEAEILWKRSIGNIEEITVDVLNDSSHENFLYVKLKNGKILVLSHTGRIIEKNLYKVVDERYEQFIKMGILGADHFDYEPIIPVLYSQEISVGYYKVKLKVRANTRYKLFDGNGLCVYEGKDETVEFSTGVYEKQIFEIRSRDSLLVEEVSVLPIENHQVVHFIGDSTMANQQRLPLYGWAQVHPLYTNLIVNNLAYSARSLKSFCFEGRFNKLLNQIKKDDIVVIGFGHNDIRETYFGSTTEEYIDYLKYYIETIKSYGAKVIVTVPIAQRHYDEQGMLLNTHKAFEHAILKEIKEVKIVNLNKLLMEKINKLGVVESIKLFNDHPDLEMKDNTHLSFYGAQIVNELFMEELNGN